ncbi:PAS domain-containing protein, partial [Sphingosinicella sp.]
MSEDFLDLSEPDFEAPPIFADQDERRMHVRAYNYWASLLRGREFPSVTDLDPASLDDFGPHSILLDFTEDRENPRLRYIGTLLREECGLSSADIALDHVPSRSLVSRLTDHFFEIIANRAPIGFEAEFVSQRGNNTLYRGILMPLSSDDDSIDFIYGV